jgi:hypothetical protein
MNVLSVAFDTQKRRCGRQEARNDSLKMLLYLSEQRRDPSMSILLVVLRCTTHIVLHSLRLFVGKSSLSLKVANMS